MRTPRRTYDVDAYKSLVGKAQNAPAIGSAEDRVRSGYEQMYGQGLTNEEMQAMRTANAQSTGAAGQAARDAMIANQRRTGNTAGVYGAMARTAKDQMNRAALGEQQILAQDAEIRRQGKEKSLAGLSGSAEMELNRYLQSMGAANQLSGQVANQQLGAAGQMLPYAQLAAQLGQYGTSGLTGLYNTSMSQDQAMYNAIASLLGLKDQEYTEIAGVKGGV